MNGSENGTAKMDKDCLLNVTAFLQYEMSAMDTMTYVLHVQHCFHCREYLETLSRLLLRRDSIARQLLDGDRL